MLLLCLAAPAGAAEDWRLEREAEGIRVWIRSVEGSPHRAVRARMVVDTPIEDIVAILRDTDMCRDWARYCEASHVHEKLGESEAYIYTHNDLPWPVPDRDVVSHVRWTEHPETGVVEMEAVATEGILARLEDVVRLTDAYSTWTLRPLESGEVEVTTEAHVDPAGPVPAWITNRLLVDAPFRSLHQLRALAVAGGSASD